MIFTPARLIVALLVIVAVVTGTNSDTASGLPTAVNVALALIGGAAAGHAWLAWRTRSER